MKDGFIKVAAASPIIKVADTDYNAQCVIETIKAADEKGVKILVFPELTLTGVSCYDIIGHKVVLSGALTALEKVVKATEGMDMLCFVGFPYAYGAKLLSCAAVISGGELLGIVPRENVKGSPFSAYESEEGDWVRVGTLETELCPNTLFTHRSLHETRVAVELGGDVTAVDSPAVSYALEGATVIAQMASFPGEVFSDEDAELRIKYQSKNLKCGLIMAAPGKGESSTDYVYTGLCMVAENGKVLSSQECESSMAVSEIDVELLMNLRRAHGGFDLPSDSMCLQDWGGELCETQLTRRFPMHPHLPDTAEELPKYCRRSIDIQVSGLVKRMEYAHLDHCVVGISGGVDSTLCVMVCAMAVKKMGLPSTNVVACTLPCFGTSSRTKSNAIVVAEQWGCEVRVIDIGKSVYQHFDDIGHAHDDYSVAFENAQARERTQVLMDIANKVNGLDVGTEDLSEFIDGWCTYNGDHTSMYDVNLGLTKTQVRTNVRYIADTTEDKVLKAALYDVLDCPVTPELLPIHDDQIEQKSEEAVGSYSLQDFFTYCILQCGFDPVKTLRLANIAYNREFTREELIRWLKSYCKRLFTQQFKRSCLMDGPAVMPFTVSPRVGLLLPSDGESTLFLKMLEELE